jgi:hypothetical protein
LLAGQPVTRNFTVQNTGNGDLTGLALTADAVTGATVSLQQPGVAALPSGQSTTCGVTFTPQQSGPHTLRLHLASNDEDEAPFDIELRATAVASEVNVEVSPSGVTEDSFTPLTFTLRRSATTLPLTVNYTLTGTATAGTDYTAPAVLSASFAAGISTATVVIQPTADATPEPNETVILTLSPGAGYGLGANASATGTILSDELPVVATANVTGITPTGAAAGGTVTSDGGTSVTERGVLYSLAPNPLLATALKVTAGGGTGAFSANLTGLAAGTIYYVRAYALNAVGTAYGESVIFTTSIPAGGPGWLPPTGLEHSMTVFAQVDRSGSKIETLGSKLAAFTGPNVAGVASPVIGPGGVKLYILTVWSSQPSVAAMPLKAYDAGTNEVLDVIETLAFQANATLGTLTAPVLYHVTPGEVEQNIPLTQGWNWISFNALPGNHSPATVLSRYTPQNDDVIKGTAGTVTWFDGQWYPPSGFTLDGGRMYMLRRQQAAPTQLTVRGLPVPSSNAINLVAGWNWLGYLPQGPRSITAAMAGATLANNDLLKSQTDGTATWFGGQWFPDTLLMQPGRGYLLRVASDQTFRYDPAPPAGAPAGPMALSAGSGPGWQVPVGKENSMTLYARVELSGQRMETDGSLLGAFENGQPAGVASLIAGPSGKVFPLTAWSDALFSPGMAVKVWDPATGCIYNLTPALNFSSNAINGTIANPLVFAGMALTPIELWRQTQFGSPENSGMGADLASPAGDGISNLVKYALGLNPHENGAGQLPVGRMVAYPSGQHLTITFTRPTSRNDVDMAVEVSSTLQPGSWSAVATSTAGSAFTGPGLVSETTGPNNTVTIDTRDPNPASGGTRRFIRVRVWR